jgi:hypothetical protein
MRPADHPESVARRVTRPGAGGVVPRPGLWERLGTPARVTMVSALPGSGKTVLLRSWIGAAGRAECVAWVPVGRDERDPQRLWLAVLDALRQTVPGSALVSALTGAPDLDGWAIVERLLKDLAPLRDRLWLVLDDLHELGSDQAQAARDWGLAARLLADNWAGLYLGGRAATVHALMAGFPAGATAAASGMGVAIVPFSALTPRPDGTIRSLDPVELREVIAIVAAPHDDLLRRFTADLKRRGLPDSRITHLRQAGRASSPADPAVMPRHAYPVAAHAGYAP